MEENKNSTPLIKDKVGKVYHTLTGIFAQLNGINIYENKQALECVKKIKLILKENHEIMTYQDARGRNLCMHAAAQKLENLVMFMLDFPEVRIQQNKRGANAGMYAANYNLEEATIKALDDKIASTQQTYDQQLNIGMIAAMHQLERATIKALDNETASLQTSVYNRTIGHYAAMYELKYATLRALQNDGACKIYDTAGHSIYTLARAHQLPTQTNKKTTHSQIDELTEVVDKLINSLASNEK